MEDHTPISQTYIGFTHPSDFAQLFRDVTRNMPRKC